MYEKLVKNIDGRKLAKFVRKEFCPRLKAEILVDFPNPIEMKAGCLVSAKSTDVKFVIFYCNESGKGISIKQWLKRIGVDFSS